MKSTGTIVDIGEVANSRLPSFVRKTLLKLFFLAVMASSFVVAVHAANLAHSTYLNGAYTGGKKSLYHHTEHDLNLLRLYLSNRFALELRVFRSVGTSHLARAHDS